MKKIKTNQALKSVYSSLPFPPKARTTGSELFLKGAVESIQCLDPGNEYTGKVFFGDRLEEAMILRVDRQWITQCTCGRVLCAHAAAVAFALGSPEMEALLEGKGAVGQLDPRSIESRFTRILGRPLGPQEIKCIRGVRQIKERVLMSGGVGSWEVSSSLGLPYPPGLSTWDGIQVYMPRSQSDYHFWLSLSQAIRMAGFKLPRHMEELADASEIEAEIHEWHHAREIKRWQNLLATEVAPPPPELIPLLDIRLRVTEDSAVFECRMAAEIEFSKPSKPALSRLLSTYSSDRLRIVPEAAPLWDLVSRLVQTKEKPALNLGNGEDLRCFGQLLRNPSLNGRIVRENGDPFERPVEQRLRWHVEEPRDGHGSYSLRLGFANGAKLPQPCRAVPGYPPLYLTADSILEGPDPCAGILRPHLENKIPKEALETTPGLNLLSRTQAELPGSLREKIREEQLSVLITCSIVCPNKYTDTRVLLLDVKAGSPDSGLLEQFSDRGWEPVLKQREAVSKPAGLIRFDRSRLAQLPSILDPLQPSWDYFQSRFRVRITKKFPDQFADWLAALPREVEVKLPAELQGLAEAPLQASVKLDCSPVDIDWFDLKVTVDVSDTELAPEEIKLLLDARGKFVNLPKKGWKRMRFNLSEDEDEQIAKLGLSPRDLSSTPQRLHTLQLADPSSASLLPTTAIEQIKERKKELQTRVAPPMPESIKAELRPYQLEGFHFLAYLSTNRFGGILADDMGLGKTLQTLTWLAWLRETDPNEKRPVLVVCPKSVAHNWENEAARFCPGLKVSLFRGGESEEFGEVAVAAAVVVINYAQLRALAIVAPSVDWLAVILDEGQFIKNPQSQTAVIARSLKAAHRLVLTGTPIENRLLDLWSLMAFAMPGVLGNQQYFLKMFGSGDDPWSRKRLSARTRPFLIRRTKSQVAKDLPDRIEEDIYCELEGEQSVLYRAEFKYAQQLLLNVKTTNDLDQFRFHFLASLLRLRQICCHPALVKEDEDNEKADSSKLTALMDILEPILEEGNKVLVFSQFVKLLQLVAAEMSKRNWNHFMLTGRTENRGELVRDFQSAEGGAVFLLSLKAGGFGLNLTEASYVVLFDPWWNPAVENQAIDRTHRIGQKNKVIAYRLLAKGTIEDKIRQMQRTKKALAEEVLGEEKFAGSLTLEDLHFLFSGEAP